MPLYLELTLFLTLIYIILSNWTLLTAFAWFRSAQPRWLRITMVAFLIPVHLPLLLMALKGLWDRLP